MDNIKQRVRREPLIEGPVPAPSRPSDYAQPEVRDAVADLEQEIGKLVAVQTAPQPVPQRTRDVGNSQDMKKVQQLVNNSITAAHEDTCKVLDKFVAEIRTQADRAEKDVHEYKMALQGGGQEIGIKLEATMHTITHTVETIEQLTKALRNPKLPEAKIATDKDE